MIIETLQCSQRRAKVCPLWTLSLQDGVCTWGSNAGTVNVYIDDDLVCTTSASSYNFNPAAYGGGKHTVVVRNAAYGWLVGSTAFEVGSHIPDGVETNLAACIGDDHTPGYSDNPTNSPCICKKPAKQPIIRFGFDHAKVRTRNLNHPNESANDAKYQHCLGILWKRSNVIDLMTYVHVDAQPHKTNALWRINGIEQDDSVLMLRARKPDDLNPDVYRIEIVGKVDRMTWDRMFLVVNEPNAAAVYSAWVTHWLIDVDWLEELPAAYESLPAILNTNGEIIGYRDPEPGEPAQWGAPKTPGAFYHHAAKREMRSSRTDGGHGHQACYDDSGNIILSGVSAGTADYVRPNKWVPRTLVEHSIHDVDPYVRALQLDGNPCLQSTTGAELNHAIIYQGTNTQNYLWCRPPTPNTNALLHAQQ